MLRNLFAKAVAISMIFASLFCVGLSAQNKPISGTVTDAQGVPVIGAAVFVVGNTSTGAMTDVDGKYTLSVPANSSIAVSCIGYATQTIQIGSESVYNVMLQEDTELLEEKVSINRLRFSTQLSDVTRPTHSCLLQHNRGVYCRHA
jgi:hypothetical protein